MASSKLFFFFFASAALLLSWTCTECRADVPEIDPLECMEMLMPCQPFMNTSRSTPVDEQCCGPLKKMALSQNLCVCGIFTDVPFMTIVNATKEEASGLLGRCGGDPGIPAFCMTNKNTTESSPTLSLVSSPSPSPTPSGGSRNVNLDLGRSWTSVLVMLMVPGIFFNLTF